MGSKRWIKLYEGIRDSSVWSDSVRLRAWIDILFRANYKDKEWFKNGQVVKVKRGQFVTSTRKLAAAWQCSQNTAIRILKQFSDLGMISYDCRSLRYTIVTVVKYGDFQDGNLSDWRSDEYSDEVSDECTDECTDEGSDGLQHKNNKNIKNGKKEKNKPDPPEGGPDDPWAWGGPKPKRWNEDDEWSWKNDQSNPDNPRMTRMEIWKFWGESDD